MIPLVAPIAIYLFAAFTMPFANILGRKPRNIYAILLALAALGSVALLYSEAMAGTATYWFGNWEPAGGIVYGITLAMDAFSWLMLSAISVLGLAVVVYSHKYTEKDESQYKYFALLFLLCAGMSGVVMTGDLFNLFVFLEISALSAVGLVAFRGEKNALAASFNYLVLASIATAFILIAVMLLYAETGTLNLADVASRMQDNFVVQFALALFIAGFAIEAALLPVHNWLPDAHSGAPSAVSALLSGAVVKMGVYGLLRVLFTLYIIAGANGLLLVLGLASMIGASFLMLRQSDIKRLLAYSTVSNVGFIIFGVGLGTFAGMSGALFHLVNHALFKGLLFLAAGAVIMQVKTRDMNSMGGLAKKMPWTMLAFAVGALAASGVPPFNGFASKWVLYNASFEISPLLTALALFASALTLAAMMKAFSGAFLGKMPHELSHVKEVPRSMLASMLLLALLCIVMGLFPDFVLEKVVNPAVNALLSPEIYAKAVLNP